MAQDKQLSKDIAAIVYLDSFVVTASKTGLKVEDFIDIVQQDTSFFQAFRNLRLLEHLADNSLQFYNKKKRVKATYNSKTQQEVKDNCRTMKILEEFATGNYFKNRQKRKHRYYTARMYESVFFTKGRICEKEGTLGISNQKLTGIQGHIQELRKLIFQPGREVDVPLIGQKTAIFKKEMLEYYNFYLQQDTSTLAKESYTFTIVNKPNYRPNKTIIKYLKTWFDKKTFQVWRKDYHLQYNGLFRFNIKMRVVLQKVDDIYAPRTIEYDGQWKIPLQKPETATFIMQVIPQ